MPNQASPMLAAPKAMAADNRPHDSFARGTLKAMQARVRQGIRNSERLLDFITMTGANYSRGPDGRESPRAKYLNKRLPPGRSMARSTNSHDSQNLPLRPAVAFPFGFSAAP